MTTPDHITDLIFSEYEKGNISDTSLVQIIEQASCYLNLKTLTNTAKTQGKSYNGIKKHSTPAILIDGVRFYSNNE